MKVFNSSSSTTFSGNLVPPALVNLNAGYEDTSAAGSSRSSRSSRSARLVGCSLSYLPAANQPSQLQGKLLSVTRSQPAQLHSKCLLNRDCNFANGFRFHSPPHHHATHSAARSAEAAPAPAPFFHANGKLAMLNSDTTVTAATYGGGAAGGGGGSCLSAANLSTAGEQPPHSVFSYNDGNMLPLPLPLPPAAPVYQSSSTSSSTTITTTTSLQFSNFRPFVVSNSKVVPPSPPALISCASSGNNNFAQLLTAAAVVAAENQNSTTSEWLTKGRVNL